jgi:3-hydroxybutyryl-CoA dehydrogenase
LSRPAGDSKEELATVIATLTELEEGEAMERVEQVAVIGAGFMGFQIALAAAKQGKNRVSVYDVSTSALQKGREAAEKSLNEHVAADGISPKEKEEILRRISFHEDLVATLQGVEMVMEAIPENLDLKREMFKTLDRHAPPHAILATNSSSYPVSKIESATQRPEKVVNIHFYFPIEKRNMADVMAGTKTSQETIQAAEEWVRSLGCVVLKLKKELMGFCFNRVWHAARLEALKMWAGGYVDFMDIDRAWIIANSVPMGPFALMDQIGLDVVYAVHSTYYQEYGDFYKPPEALNQMVERGDLGVKTGKGFYVYPNPDYQAPDFLKP